MIIFEKKTMANKIILFTSIISLVFLNSLMAQDFEVDTPYGLNVDTDIFGYNSKAVGSHSFGWYENEGKIESIISGYNGIKLLTAGAKSRLTILQSGRIGIGTDTPTTKLELGGLGSIDGIKIADRFSLLTFLDNFYLEQNKKEGDLYVRSRGYNVFGATGNLILNDLGGNVGVGTTTPSTKLHLGGLKDIDGITIDDDFELLKWGNNMYMSKLAPLGNLYLRSRKRGATNPTSHLIINDTGGNVGVGTTAPSVKLEVNGEIRSILASNNTDKNVAGIVSLGNSGITGASNWAIRGAYQYSNGIHYNSIGGDLDLIKSLDRNIILATKTNGTALGNVGIGTVTPTEKLDVNGNAKIGDNNWGGLTIDGKEKNNWLLNAHSDGQRFYFRTQTDDGSPDSSIVMTMMRNSGRVGIGTVNPRSKLQVNGKITIGIADNAVVHSIESGVNVNGTPRTLRFNHSSIIENEGFEFFNTVLNKQLMFIEGSGNVGIGTADTKGYKLAVDGKVITEEVKVQLSENWTVPDYVFKADYKLPTLEEVENHINEKGHLENIPSAAEVEKQGGIFIGEMNLKLLEKIEELTLYTIAQEKKIEKLEGNTIKAENLESQLKLQGQQIVLLMKMLEKLKSSN